MTKDKMYDVGIIGAGPAGMTAAIYAARADKQVLLIDKAGYGGQIALSPMVKNIPGFSEISGADFAENMYKQVEAYDNITFEVAEIRCLKYLKGLIALCGDNEINFYCKTLIIATGAEHKKLELPTEDIYYCATCDGPLFKNKTVFVVGSGNTGAVYALDLASYCKDVFISDVTMDMCCEATLQKQLQAKSNIHWLPNCTIKAVKNSTKGKLSSVTLTTDEEIKCQGIFVAIGMVPQTEFAKNLVTYDDKKYIIADDSCEDKLVPGVFVAGDCRTKSIRQVVTATADGATAAIGALNFLRKNNI